MPLPAWLGTAPHLSWRRGAELSHRSGAAPDVAAGGGRAALGGDAATAAERRRNGGRSHGAGRRAAGARRHSQHGGGAAPALPAAPARRRGESSRELGVRGGDMEPGGGGAGPLPANNKARGGAAPPGKGRDLGRPPRKDSEVSAVSANAAPGSVGGGRRPSREGRGGGRAGSGRGGARLGRFRSRAGRFRFRFRAAGGPVGLALSCAAPRLARFCTDPIPPLPAAALERGWPRRAELSAAPPSRPEPFRCCGAPALHPRPFGVWGSRGRCLRPDAALGPGVAVVTLALLRVNVWFPKGKTQPWSCRRGRWAAEGLGVPGSEL